MRRYYTEFDIAQELLRLRQRQEGLLDEIASPATTYVGKMCASAGLTAIAHEVAGYRSQLRALREGTTCA